MAATTLLFDLDGTVWDSHRWFAVLVADGDATGAAAALADLRQRRPAARLLREAGVTRAKFAALARGPQPAALYQHAAATLRELVARGCRLGAVTNLPGWMALPMLAGLGLDTLFGSVVTYERTHRHKPAPDPLCLALEELEVDATPDTWYVGDTAGDARAAAAAGISFAWASWGYEPTPPMGVAKRLKRWSEVLEL